MDNTDIYSQENHETIIINHTKMIIFWKRYKSSCRTDLPMRFLLKLECSFSVNQTDLMTGSGNYSLFNIIILYILARE